MSSPDPEEAWRRFYQEYGNAMVAWQILESEIATLFSYLTKIPLPMAVQIYYSSRSFNGRMDVYKGGVSASTVNAEVKSAARAVASKAQKYAAYRNKFAHDLPLLRQQQSPPIFDVLMVDGKGQFQPEDVRGQYINDGIAIDEITYAATLFRQLADLTRHFWVQHRAQSPGSQGAWLETLRELLHALPNLPRQEALFPPSAEPKRQRPPSRG